MNRCEPVVTQTQGLPTRLTAAPAPLRRRRTCFGAIHAGAGRGRILPPESSYMVGLASGGVAYGPGISFTATADGRDLSGSASGRRSIGGGAGGYVAGGVQMGGTVATPPALRPGC